MKYTLKELPPGWRWRETPGHGYLVIPDEHNQNVPECVRNHEYEEDCEYATAIVFNKDLFQDRVYADCLKVFKDWDPDGYEKTFGVKLQRGESYIKDDFYFRRKDNIGRFEKRSCFGDWCFDVPRGMIYAMLSEITESDAVMEVSIAKGGREVTVLLTKEQYDSGGPYDLSELQQYHRDTTYYTWEHYTKQTGKERYK